MFAVNGQQRNDDAEADQVDEDRQEDHKNRRASFHWANSNQNGNAQETVG
jgi:hypothetical protein